MSFMYYRVDPPRPKSPEYGFGHRTAKEIRDITERLTKSTYERKLATLENKQVSNYAYLMELGNRRRFPSACRERNMSKPPSSRGSDGKRLNERDMGRLIRRLMKPTESRTNAKINPNEDQDLKEGRIVRPKSWSNSEQVEKTIRRISRPTTATRAKTVSECHLCYDHEQKREGEPPDAFDYDYSERKNIPSEELDFIVERVAIPTCASAKGNRTCSKTPVYIDEVKIRERLPLVSGLGRSKNVNEIVDRLHPKRKYHAVRPMATEITVY